MAKLITLPQNAIVRDIELHLSGNKQVETVCVQQYDSNSVYIRATVYENGSLYTITESDNVEYISTKPNGDGICNSCGRDNEGKIIYEVTANTTAQDGWFDAQFKIHKSTGGTKSTPKFKMSVDRAALLNETVLGVPEFNVLDELITDANEAINTVANIKSNEQYRINNENTRIDNEEDRQVRDAKRPDWVKLTQAQYDALSMEQKMSNTFYEIMDDDGEVITDLEVLVDDLIQAKTAYDESVTAGSNTEVVKARKSNVTNATYNVVGDRLDTFDRQLAQTANQKVDKIEHYNLQNQVNNIVIKSDGESNAENIQSRVNKLGGVHSVVKEHLDYIEDYVKNKEKIKYNIGWKIGSYGPGGYVTSTNRIIATNKLTTTKKTTIHLSDYSKYKFNFCTFDSSGTYQGFVGWKTSDYTISAGITILITLGYVDDSTITSAYSDIFNALDITEEETIDKEKMTVHYLNNNDTGDCTIIELPNGKTLMIDLGQNSSYMTNHLKEKLTTIGISKIDYIVISHYHDDHVGQIENLSNNFNISGAIVWLPALTAEQETILNNFSPTTYSWYQKTLQVLTNKWCDIKYPTSDFGGTTIGGVRIEFFNVNHDSYYSNLTNYNECSLCCRITYGETVLLFTGDMANQGMDKYATKMRKCNIYKADHHAVGNYRNNKFMSAILPDAVITMLGYSVATSLLTVANSYLQTWCEKYNVPNYVTGIANNDIVLEVTKSGWKISSDSRRCIREDENIQ